MIKNYLKIAWRNLVKQSGISFISVFGLSLGIACFSLIGLYAINEFSFDSFHKNAKDIYRVYTWTGAMNGSDASGSILTPMPLGPAMKRDLSGVEDYVRYLQPYETYVKTENEGKRENIAFADPSFFTVFSFKIKYGNPATALKGLNNIVLTAAAANRIFGKTNVVGKSIQVKVEDRFATFTVSAIAENPPVNSSFQFSMLSSFNYFETTSFGKMSENRWGYMYPFITYIQLKPGSRLASNASALADFIKTHFPNEEKDARNQGWHGQGPYHRFGLEPISDIHTDTRFAFNKTPAVDPKAIWILLSIAAGVLLIACINFTTLAIGRSANRAKEIGVRKLIGGTRKTLMIQFLTESLLLTIISTTGGLLLVKLLLPLFNQLSDRGLSVSNAQLPQLALLLIILVLVVSILSGIYPSLLLSRFKPVEVLKTKVRLGGANFFTRLLVTFQFVLSAGLVIATVIIVQQLHYIQAKDPGFNKENVVVVEAVDIPGTKNLFPLLKHELVGRPEIVGIASAENGLGENEGMSTNGFTYYNKPINPVEYFADPDYIGVLGMKLLAGRDFNPAIASDTVTSVIVNEAMMNAMGLTLKHVVGQKLTGYYGNGKEPVIIGVVRNFNYLDMKQRVQPQMFDQFSSHQPYHFFVRINPGNPAKALAAIQTAWKNVAPDYPLKYNFLDDDMDRFYKSEERLRSIIGLAGGISIFLACLGLFGLATLAAVNRTKEIGIRKVLGAKLSAIIGLISKDFLKLVMLAFAIAVPLAWYFMNKWLQDYAYRININWWVFVVTGVAITSIALITVSFQAIKAGMANPVKSLRSE